MRKTKLLIATLYQSKDIFNQTIPNLEAKFGPVEAISDPVPFDHSHYYDTEMGKPLTRQFLTFQRLVSPVKAPEIKAATMQVEDQFSVHQRRQINLDPGFITPYNLILLSSKNFSHRIPVSETVFAEVTLIVQKNRYVSLPWTYTDYKMKSHHDFFTQSRQTLKEASYDRPQID